MSSRALRKAQKERELREQHLQLEHDEEASDEADSPVSNQKKSAFAMLSEMNDADEDGDEDKEEEISEKDSEGGNIRGFNTPSKPPPSAKRMKKKRKNKRKQTGAEAGTADIDEIEEALKSLSASDVAKGLAPVGTSKTAIDYTVLAVELHHLNVGNEMRRLFGKAAFTAEQEERRDNQRHVQHGEGVALCEAVSGKMAVGGPGLSAILRKKRVFVEGKEEWPKNTANGLGMVVEARNLDGTTTYRFVHNKDYRISQVQFEQDVAIMDPMNLVNLLRYNPYHVATLLQVSEIAKQEKDYSTAGELLERALFAFGKALHPRFVSDLERGTARLDFARPENREFYLSAWKYIINIGMRATWRTAYEWARLVFALSPSRDPYCVGLYIDQLALRARQPAGLLELIDNDKFEVGGLSPSIAYSRSLALHMLGRHDEARQELETNVRHFPWIAARLYQQIDAGTAPSVIWGKMAKSDKDVLYTELYVTLAQDIWKLQEAAKFLTSTISNMPKTRDSPDETVETHEQITLDEARHVILLDTPQLISLLPRHLTNQMNSMSDPLPPADSLESYHIVTGEEPIDDPPAEETLRDNPKRFVLELMGLHPIATGVLRGDTSLNAQPFEEEFTRLADVWSLGSGLLHERFERYRSLQRVLFAQPGRHVESEGHAVWCDENGTLQHSAPPIDFAQYHDMTDVELMALARQRIIDAGAHVLR